MQKEKVVEARGILNQIEETEEEIKTMEEGRWVFTKKHVSIIQRGFYEKIEIYLSKEDVHAMIDLRKRKLAALEKELEEL